MKQQTTNKLKSYSFWVSLSGALIIVAQSIGKAFGFEFDEAVVNNIITSICGALVVLGVISSPTIPKISLGTEDIERILNLSADEKKEETEEREDDEE